MHTISYDILCNFLCFHVPARAGSNAAPLRLKSGPDPVQMRPSSNPMLSLLIPYVCLSSLASKSGCSGLLIHTRRRGSRFRPPPPPLPGGRTRASPPPEGAILPPPPPQVIRRWRETCSCACWAWPFGAGMAGHLRICRQMHMQHRLGAVRPYLTAP